MSAALRGIVRRAAPAAALAVLMPYAACLATAALRPSVDPCGAAVRDTLTAVPFESPAGLVIVRARAGDGSTLRLLVDTGDSGGVTLTGAAAAALGLATGPARVGTARALGSTAPVTMRRARLGSLCLGDVVWRDLEVDVAPASLPAPPGIGADIDGTLGMGLLTDIRLTLDYVARTLTPAHGPRADAARRADSLAGAPLEIVGGLAVTTIRIAGSPCAAIVDTASAATLVDRGLVPPGPSASGAARLVDALGRVEILPTIRLDDLAAGGAEPIPVEVVAVDLGRRLQGLLPPSVPAPVVVLGANALAGRRVLLDPDAGLFRLEGPTP